MANIDSTGEDNSRNEGDEPEVYETPEFSENLSADNDQDELVTEEQLALDDGNERLPWLDTDDDYEEDGGNGRVMALALMGLVALGVIVGGIWWATHRTPDETLVADGSTIAAPAQPYKEAPKDPGGKTFDGTGNTAFAVSEGQTRPAKLGEASGAAAAPKPGFDVGGKPTAAASPKPGATAVAAPANAAPVSGPVVQVGAYTSRASAEAAWGRLSQQYSALSGVRHQSIEGKADIGTVFRLQAIPGDAAAAQSLCGRLKAAGLACQVK